MVKIYLSSTFKDLIDYRSAVIQALRKAGHLVEAMENYIATGNHPPLAKCLADVEGCECYVGIFARRYGYVPPENNPENKAITELEYRTAQKLNKPCFIFLLDPEVPWIEKFMDSATGDGDQGARIRAFRQELETDKLVSTFRSPDDLATLVTAAISSWQTEKLSEENAQLVIQAFDLDASDKLLLDTLSIELINITLDAARKRYQEGRLTDAQIAEFNTLKRQVHDLLAINRQLRLAANKARQLLRQTRESIQADLERLQERNQNLVQQDEMLKQYQEILEAGQEAAHWLDSNRTMLVKRSAKEALDSYPEFKGLASPKMLDDYEWDLEKYLKRISHCLIWSNYARIDEPDGLVVFPLKVYEAAFLYIKERRIEHNPPDISPTAIALLLDCFEYLLRRLA